MDPYCFNCKETFADDEAYQRHWWREHGGELDKGEAYSPRPRLESFKPEDEYPDPPTLPG